MNETRAGLALLGRNASTRLPKKSLLEVCGRPVLVHQIDRLKLSRHVHPDVDFAVSFHALRMIPYQGPFLLETTTGDNPLEYARRHLAFVRKMMIWAEAGQNLSDSSTA